MGVTWGIGLPEIVAAGLGLGQYVTFVNFDEGWECPPWSPSARTHPPMWRLEGIWVDDVVESFPRGSGGERRQSRPILPRQTEGCDYLHAPPELVK